MEFKKKPVLTLFFCSWRPCLCPHNSAHGEYCTQYRLNNLAYPMVLSLFILDISPFYSELLNVTAFPVLVGAKYSACLFIAKENLKILTTRLYSFFHQVLLKENLKRQKILLFFCRTFWRIVPVYVFCTYLP